MGPKQVARVVLSVERIDTLELAAQARGVAALKRRVDRPADIQKWRKQPPIPAALYCSEMSAPLPPRLF